MRVRLEVPHRLAFEASRDAIPPRSDPKDLYDTNRRVHRYIGPLEVVLDVALLYAPTATY